MNNQRSPEVVFYRDWFKRNQARLLWFANTKIGRRVLRIDGDRSSVGNNNIVKIEPNAITWVDNGNLVAEFRTHAKFAKRLYYQFKWVWQLMHIWDMVVANRLFPSLNLGFDTLTKYPDAHPETNTVDGLVMRTGVDESWSTIRSGAGNFFFDTVDSEQMVLYTSSFTTNQWDTIMRSLFLFDTTTLGSNAVVQSATASFYGHNKNNSFPSAQLSVTLFAWGSSALSSKTTLQNSDYNQFGGVGITGTTISYSGWSTSAYNDFAISNLSKVNTTTLTMLGLRSTHDASNSAPTWSSFKQTALAGHYADKTGTSNDPKLVVTYGVLATISNSVSFEIGDDIPLTISNPNGLDLTIKLYVDNTLVKTEVVGNVTSHTIEPDSGEEDDMYQLMPNNTSKSMFVRIESYLGVNLLGSTDKTGTCSVDQVASKPVFTTFTLANVDKNVVVTDTYGETLVTSSTATLLGSSDRMIQNISQVRGTVSVLNKMVAQNFATEVKYRLSCGVQQAEVNFDVDDPVTVDINNAAVNSFIMTAFDSRNLTTAVNGSLGLLAEWTPVVVSNLQSLRDDFVKAPTKISFEGLLWNKYFSTNTTSGGSAPELNDLTTHVRWKRANHAWGALDGTFTITIASPGVVTKTAHGFQTGDQVWFTTTGALPTGLSVSTVYYVIVVDANTFRLATSFANAEAGTAINTSGSQSGVHTLHGDSMWDAISPSVDGSGNISFDDYIDGDLGAGGFTASRAFTVQVRVFDKLSFQIAEVDIAVGDPVIDFTKDGIAIKAKYDTAMGGHLQVHEVDIRALTPLGWEFPYTLVYDGANSAHIDDIDLTHILHPGTLVELVNNGVTKYTFIISSTFSSPDTVLMFTTLNDTNEDVITLHNSAITDVWFGFGKTMRSHPGYVNYTPTVTPSAGSASSVTGDVKVSFNGPNYYLEGAVEFTQNTSAPVQVDVGMPVNVTSGFTTQITVRNGTPVFENANCLAGASVVTVQPASGTFDTGSPRRVYFGKQGGTV